MKAVSVISPEKLYGNSETFWLKLNKQKLAKTGLTMRNFPFPHRLGS